MSDVPKKGKCKDCKEQIEFHEDGSGVCVGCGRLIWWDKTRAPPEEEEVSSEEEIDEEIEEEQAEIPEQPWTSEQPMPAPIPQQPVAQPMYTAQQPGEAPYLPAQPYQYPPAAYPYPPQVQQPMSEDQLDPGTRKAWKKLKRRFKGGFGPGAVSGIVAGILYIALPIIIFFLLTMYIPAQVSSELPELGKLLQKLWVMPVMMGWLMVSIAFAKKYYRRGTPQRAVAGVSFQAAKGMFLYGFLAPFVISISVRDMLSLGLDYSNYIDIIYILIALGAVYAVFEYFALKKDLESYCNGDIPEDYYPRKYRKEREEGMPPQQPGAPPYPEQQPMVPPQQYPPQQPGVAPYPPAQPYQYPQEPAAPQQYPPQQEPGVPQEQTEPAQQYPAEAAPETKPERKVPESAKEKPVEETEPLEKEAVSPKQVEEESMEEALLE